MAGQRQPIELLLIKGNKHLTKAEVEERKSREVKAPSDKVRAPSHLPKELKSEFNRLSKILVSLKLMSNLDVGSLVRYLYAEHEWNKNAKKLFSMDCDDESYMDTLIKQDKLFNQCRKAANDLALTITSRCKLVIPKEDEKPPKTEEELLFGDNL